MNWTSRIVVLLLLAVIIGVPLFMKQSTGTTRGDLNSPHRLVVFTPHNEQIRFEIAQSFNRWRAARGQPAVVFDWRSGGGTSDLRKQVISEYEATARRALRDGKDLGGVGYDLFFGGGEYEHNKFATPITVTERVTVDGKPQDKSLKFFVSVPVRMPDGMLEETFPTPDIAGARLYHPDRRWVGVVLASFGIVYNRDVLSDKGMPEPKTWTDLTDPRYRGLIALADPAHSGSIAEAYNAILQRLGWNEGWPVLRRIFANAKTFTSVSTKVSVDVSSGDCAAGMTIDFYGRFQAGAVDDPSRKVPRLGYIDPAGMTKVNADPISILHGAPHAELANQFVVWLLTKEGQRIWQRKLGAADGPVKFELRRQPVRRDLYTDEEMAYWTDPIKPFETSQPFAPGMPDMYNTVATISHAMAIDVHDDLAAAWRAVQQCKDPAKKAKLEAMFDRVPPELRLEGLPADWLMILNDPKHAQYKEIAAKLKTYVADVQKRWSDLRIPWPPEAAARWKEILAKPDDPLYGATAAALAKFFENDDPAWSEELKAAGEELKAAWKHEMRVKDWRAFTKDPNHPLHREAISTLAAFVANWKPRDNQLKDRLRWTLFFRDSYREIVREAGTD